MHTANVRPSRRHETVPAHPASVFAVFQIERNRQNNAHQKDKTTADEHDDNAPSRQRKLDGKHDQRKPDQYSQKATHARPYIRFIRSFLTCHTTPRGIIITYFSLFCQEKANLYFLQRRFVLIHDQFSSRYFSASAHQSPLCFSTIVASTAKRLSVFANVLKSSIAVNGNSICV